MGVKRRMTREAAYKVLRDGGQRHDRNIAADQPGSKEKLFAPKLLATYEAACRRKRDYIKEAVEAEQRLDRLVEALRLIMSDKRFRLLLVSEGLATMPKRLAQRLQGTTFEPETAAHASEPLPSRNAGRQPVSGICPDVLDFLQDCPVKVKIFGLLRHVLPARQLEIARLMVAMERVTFTYAKILVAFTPRALLAEGFDPAMIANVSEDQLGAMTPELGRLGSEFLSAVERRGSVSLELLATSRYFDRLMDNSKVVRYLARNFPAQFEEFHSLSLRPPNEWIAIPIKRPT
ncbi:plasmid partitioning protein RepB C-terminal domain-containing protein [Mesorhizobium dulcispinae]|uniref:plasmid partitioning protein RepB C-terminal domain-containing protein n=1 Tax=Mesorhizobium dulcispinae TaxID=3072316 RepID=UPI002A246FED|nr:plasmid partitioning protein RepB C-terminal domain-containing protein [Mesorhizobium sp. VK23D]MDX8521153.1 plasmid partitioning protein RepB C-terminal domain-containing protein [Mesorhizobium sp. VK23D]